MAGGSSMERVDQYQGKVTFRVVIAAYVAFLFGWTVGYSGILGHITREDAFDEQFLVEISGKNPRDYDYCEYKDKYRFTLLGGPLYLAGALASMLSYPFTRRYGRRISLILAGVVSLSGAALGVYPTHLALYLLDLIILGFGVGLGSQATLLYLSEMAPPRSRGALSMTFQLSTAVGMLGGNMIRREFDRETAEEWVPYVSFALPVVLALLIVWGGTKYLRETPNSLVERGSVEKGRESLVAIRGTRDVDAEFRDIVDAGELANANRRNHFLAAKNIFQRRNRPHLVMAVLMPLFRNLTGWIFMLFYGPLLFRSFGFKFKSATYSTAINGSILVLSTAAAMVTVDRLGRRVLLIGGGVLMFLSQVTIAIMLGSNLFSDQLTTERLSILVTVLIGVFVMAYGLSWGPLGLTIPSEIFTLETRSVGISITVSVNLLFAYLVLQFFVPLLCAFKYGLFLFFAGWIVVMTVFVCLFLPETKGVPIEKMGFLWSKHWFWKSYVAQDSQLLLLHVAPTSPTPKHV